MGVGRREVQEGGDILMTDSHFKAIIIKLKIKLKNLNN